jgi:hypothetical protein
LGEAGNQTQSASADNRSAVAIARLAGNSAFVGLLLGSPAAARPRQFNPFVIKIDKS